MSWKNNSRGRKTKWINNLLDKFLEEKEDFVPLDYSALGKNAIRSIQKIVEERNLPIEVTFYKSKVYLIRKTV